MEWISVNKALPFVPKDKRFVIVIGAIFDPGYFSATNGNHDASYDIGEVTFARIRANVKYLEDFNTLDASS
jgi:hypothetical protein